MATQDIENWWDKIKNSCFIFWGKKVNPASVQIATVQKSTKCWGWWSLRTLLITRGLENERASKRCWGWWSWSEKEAMKRKKSEKKLNMRWTFFNPWILCVLRVSHLNKNGRKRESYKQEGSLSLFFWIQSFHWIYVWPNKWIEDRREIERSEGGVGVEMWFQTLASFLYTKQRNPGCGKCHRASLFGLPLRIDVRSTHEMAISTIATKIQNSI